MTDKGNIYLDGFDRGKRVDPNPDGTFTVTDRETGKQETAKDRVDVECIIRR